MENINHIEDKFFKSLIKSNGLNSPSADFTANVMSQIIAPTMRHQTSSRLLGKNLTLGIFVLVGIINILIFYFIWPYITVWIPENSFFIFALNNLKLFIQSHLLTLVQRSASLSLLFIISLGIITLFGKEELFHQFQKITKRFTY